MSPADDRFESQRPALKELAYRMLGDAARAEDMVQEAWLRWREHRDEVESPRAWLLQVVSNLCLHELESARHRREELRADRLPEPVDLGAWDGMARAESTDQVSMAFMVLLQRLTPSERAAFLLHTVFDLSHKEVAALLHKSEPACRQLLKRAKQNVARERRLFSASPQEHRRLLEAFVRSSVSGDAHELERLLAEDAVLIADGGPKPVGFGGLKNLPRPVRGAKRIGKFVATVSPRGLAGPSWHAPALNGQPAMVLLRQGRPEAAILLSVAGGRIHRIFIQGDPARLRHLGPLH
jgi:RNA polymerase sigma-70 factor (ECF subfamily)